MRSSLKDASDRTRGLAAFVAQLALRLHVVEAEWIDVLLTLIRRAMTEDDDVAALSDGGGKVLQVICVGGATAVATNNSRKH
jgi:hypothetical protein